MICPSQIIRILICLQLLSVYLVAAQTWSYAENGAVRWVDSYPECGGNAQSPIEITHIDAIPATAGFLKLWTPFRATPTTLKIVADSRYLQILFGDRGIQLTGNMFRANMVLKEIHFHTPSEHTLNGVRYPMEAHMVLAPYDYEQRINNGETRYDVVVLAFLYTSVSTATSSKLVQMVAENAAAITTTSALHVSWEPKFYLAQTYYTYKGSSTTPPCEEVFTWYVAKDPLPARTTDVEAIEAATKRVTGSSNGNFRPIQ
eukprot:PhM_4_TR2423/c0_g1_i3/m.22257